jgi:hypothetical protein
LTSSKLKSLDAIISWEDVLIAALVTFDVPGGASLAEMTASFEQSAPKFSGMPGVIAKYYLFDGAMTGGAFYVLSSREHAARMFNGEWRKMLTERYGSPPNLSVFEVPVTVTNANLLRAAKQDATNEVGADDV